MPSSRARTIRIASAMVNSVWAAISETRPSCEPRRRAQRTGQSAASTGLTSIEQR